MTVKEFCELRSNPRALIHLRHYDDERKYWPTVKRDRASELRKSDLYGDKKIIKWFVDVDSKYDCDEEFEEYEFSAYTILFVE